MRRILLPLEQTDRSLKALQYFRKHYSPEDAAVVLMMVDESLGYTASKEEEDAAIKKLEEKLELLKAFLAGYEVFCKADLGKAGPRIVRCAREYGVSLIAMTKSSQADMINQIGRTTEYVLIYSPCNVCIVSESRDSSEYRGLVYTKAKGSVNLRGQIGDKQSECMLPSVAADCNYHFEVSVGKVRFYHTVYNPNTGNWDLPPGFDQEASVDISAGESADILVKMGSTEGKADRIRVINRGMKQEAVFNYLITPIIESVNISETDLVQDEELDSLDETNYEESAYEERTETTVIEETIFEPEEIVLEAPVYEPTEPVVEEMVYEPAEPIAEEMVYEPTEPVVEETIFEPVESVVEESFLEPAVPEISYVDEFRGNWKHDDYFAEVFEKENQTDILGEYLADWRFCAGEDEIAYVPDEVIVAAETESLL